MRATYHSSLNKSTRLPHRAQFHTPPVVQELHGPCFSGRSGNASKVVTYATSSVEDRPTIDEAPHSNMTVHLQIAQPSELSSELVLPSTSKNEKPAEEELFPEIQLQLPTPTHSKVKSASYISSAVRHEDCPAPKYPEFAIIGRSNVGKSSLINMLTNSKKLAHVSKEPGKTRCINHFLINDSWYLVDLPGYGYARTGLANREAFDSFTKEYFTSRSSLAMVLLLVDSTIKPQKIDLEYATWLTDNGVPFSIVFTKIDRKKKGSSSKEENITAFKRALLQDFEYLPPSFMTSSEDGTGKSRLLNFIASLRVAYEQSGLLSKR